MIKTLPKKSGIDNEKRDDLPRCLACNRRLIRKGKALITCSACNDSQFPKCGFCGYPASNWSWPYYYEIRDKYKDQDEADDIPLYKLSVSELKAKLESMSQEAIDYSGMNVLFDAYYHKPDTVLSIDLIELLLKHISDDAINATDNMRQTALHQACYNAWHGTEQVQPLLDKMSDEAINAKDKYGMTALHFAHSSLEKIKLLLKRIPIAALNAKSNYGRTILDMAYYNESPKEVIDFLCSNMDKKLINKAKKFKRKNKRNYL